MKSTLMAIPSRIRILLGLIFLSQTTSFVFSLVALLVHDIPGLDSTSAAIALSSTMLLMSVLGPYVGKGLDLGHGVRWSFVAAISYSMGILGFMFSSGLQIISIIPVLLSYFISMVIGQTLISALVEGYIDPDLRQKTATLLSTSGNLAMIFANLIAFFYFKTHRQLLLALDLMTNLILFGYMAYCFKEYVSPTKNSNSGSKVNPWTDVFKVFRKYPLEVTSCTILFSAIYAQMYIFPMLFKANEVDSYKFTTLMGTINGALVVLIGILVASNLVFKTIRSQLIATCAFTGVGFFLMPYVDSLTSLIVVVTIWSFGEITIYPVTTKIIYSIFPDDEIGIAAATKGMLARFSQVITPLVALCMFKMTSLTQSMVLALPLLFSFFTLSVFIKKNIDTK